MTQPTTAGTTPTTIPTDAPTTDPPTATSALWIGIVDFGGAVELMITISASAYLTRVGCVRYVIAGMRDLIDRDPERFLTDHPKPDYACR